MAAGQGTRLGAGMPKALVLLGRGADAEPVVVHALRSALRCADLTDVVVVAPADPEGMARLAAALQAAGLPGPDASSAHERTRVRVTPDAWPAHPARVQVVPGGAERSDSVARGLAALPPEVGIVLVHDAARALTPADVFARVVAAVREGHAAVTPGLPVVDTVKQVEIAPDGAETVVTTVDRTNLRAVQTPQGFLRETLERAHSDIEHAVTDDAGLVEALGGRVHVVLGDPRALKITTPHDLEVAAAWIAEDARALGTAARHAPGVLIVLSGLPGVGKTTLARELGRRLGAAHLRVDTIEQGLLRGGLSEQELAAQGYGAAYALATDQLALGLPVVADMVNGITLVREAWDGVAEAADAGVVRVMVECSDREQHRRQVVGRTADIEGLRLPDWEQVTGREVRAWPEAHLHVDTATETAQDAAARITAHLQETS